MRAQGHFTLLGIGCDFVKNSICGRVQDRHPPCCESTWSTHFTLPRMGCDFVKNSAAPNGAIDTIDGTRSVPTTSARLCCHSADIPAHYLLSESMPLRRQIQDSASGHLRRRSANPLPANRFRGPQNDGPESSITCLVHALRE